MKQRHIDISVGGFVLLGMIVLAFISLKVAHIDFGQAEQEYVVFTEFDQVGGLKEGASVRLGGVVIGSVRAIELDPDDLTPLVTLGIYQKFNQIPNTSSASIMTAGLLGAQYVGIISGFVEGEETVFLSDQSTIHDTRSALVLEDLIGQFMFSIKED